jgi:D-amino-acid dehydrogenase
MGVAIEEGVEVLELGPDRRRPRLRTSAGERDADAVVLAAGAWSAALVAGVGFRLPLEAGKGYSFEVEAEAMPHRAVELIDAYVVFTPLSDRLRVAGTMEFSGINSRLNESRIEAMIHIAARALPSLRLDHVERRWTGMRPIVPDGLPVIDSVPGHENLYLAAAFSMLGMTLAPPAGEALARQILTGIRPPELEPFRADRWVGPWWRPRAAAR